MLRKGEPIPLAVASQSALTSAASASASASTAATVSPSARPRKRLPPQDAGPDECILHEERGMRAGLRGRCCPTSCDPVGFDGYTAVNAKYKAQFIAHERCAEVKCSTCRRRFKVTPQRFELLRALQGQAMRRGEPSRSPYSHARPAETARCASGWLLRGMWRQRSRRVQPSVDARSRYVSGETQVSAGAPACHAARSPRAAECTGGGIATYRRLAGLSVDG